MLDDLIQSLKMDPSNRNNWLQLLHYLILDEKWAEINELFQQRDSFTGDAFQFAFVIVSNPSFMSKEVSEKILNFHIDQNINPYSIGIIFSKACLLLSIGRFDEALSNFKICGMITDKFPYIKEKIPHLNGLSWIYEQIEMYFSSDLFLRLGQERHVDARDTRLLMSNFKEKSKFSKEVPLFLVACNDVYFKRFADEYIQTMECKGPIHFHIVGGDEALLFSIISKYPQAEISYSFEEDNDIGSVYYACSRFLILPEFMQHAERDIIVTDIDIEGVFGLEDIIEKSKEKEIALFEQSTNIPWLKYAAGYLYLKKDSALAQDFSIRLCFALRETMPKAKWLADQLAIYVVLYSIIAKYPRNLIRIFSEFDGFSISETFQATGTIEEKSKLQKNIDYFINIRS